ncbi:MAG: type II secretion system F family protein [Rhodocyclaceae bacterium]|nr:type II secretion system F family protein [Rhodocyclaceae bacterium]MBK6677651.1 type II secretion system F family protein [Rhodocyclaceae bacterium]
MAALFHYKATSAAGEVSEGDMEARDESAVVARLQDLGLIPIQVAPGRVVEERSSGGLFSRRRISQNQVGALTAELATLLRAGLPLDRALEILIGLSDNPYMQGLMTRVRDDVRGGAALSKALEAHPAVFSRFYIGMIRAGEAGGALGTVLARISEFMERSKELKETVKSALIYPTILVLASVTSVMLLLIFVVPQFSQMFEQSGKALPLATRIVIAAGDWLRKYWWALPLIILLVWRYFSWQMGNAASKARWDGRFLRLPLVGDLLTKIEVARFARTLGTLLANGVPLLAALGVVKDTVGNSVIADGLAAAREQLQAGQGLSKPLMAQEVFPPLAVHMVGVGEETGRLDEMLTRVADVYDREVALAVKRMLALLEPVMILGLGLIIGGIIISILLAILKVNSLVG